MIWFMAPDLAEMSGGIKMLYRMASALNGLGRPATIWHGTPGHRYNSFESDAPVYHGLYAPLEPGDVLVMQEVGGPKWSFLAGDAPVVMLCQGYSFLFDNLDFETTLPAGYPGWPHATAAIVTSRYIERVVRAMSGAGLPVFRVPVTVDGGLFVPRDKERMIAYMPRRRRADLVAAIQLVRRQGWLPQGWTLQAIDHQSEAGVGDILGRASVFVSAAEREGFGLPGAEAMAAGCYVVGYTGNGGAEYMAPDWCTVVPDSDILALAQGIADAASRFDTDHTALCEQASAGRAKVLSDYSPTQMAHALDAAFERICAPGSPSLITQAQSVPHFQTHAPKPGLIHGAYRGARAMARRVVGPPRN